MPVYWGAPDIEKHIPIRCYIDRRDYGSYEELIDYLVNMPDSEYQEYLSNIKYFLENYRDFDANNWCETILKNIEIK